MADTRRLVKIAWDGTVTVVQDLEDHVNFWSVRDSFTVSPGGRTTIQSGPARRYAGTRAVSETNANGTIGWQIMVKGSTATAALASVEALLGNIEAGLGLWIEWKPVGAASSTYYEVRGPAVWKPTYSWAQFSGARSLGIDVQVPVAPLAWGDKQTISWFGSSAMYSGVVAADSPAGWWRLAEPSGTTAADASGNSHPGTYVGTPTLGATGPITGEPADTAVTLNGSTQYVNVPYAASLMPSGAGGFTLEAWVKPTALSGTQDIVATYDGANGSNFAIDSTGHLFLGTPAAVYTSTGTISAGVWTYVAMTYDGTNARFYINGVLSGTVGAPTWTTSTTGPFRIGARADTGLQQFAGSIDEVAKYSTVLSVTRLLAHYNAAAVSSSGTLPLTVQIGTAIPGDAPALADITLTNPTGGSTAPIWALFGWTQRPGSPLSGSVAPFGIIEAETGGTLTGWAVTADAGYGGGSGLKITTSGAGTASALFTVDPSVMQPDAFTPGETDIELWARVGLDSTVVTPRMILSLLPLAGSTFGGEQFSAEYGSTGKTLTVPSSGTGKMRFVRLGILSLPVDTARPVKWNIKVAANWAAGSTGALGLDRLILVPARQRAVSVSGKANDASYPKFIASTGAATKTIRSDLSGLVASGAANPSRDSGLGGTPIELPPGNIDMLIKLSDLVADDPTADATSEATTWPGVTGSLIVTPRYWLARGT